MEYQKLKQYYLCGIGTHGNIDHYDLGRKDEDRKSFSFRNGSYANVELYREPVGSSSVYVITALPLTAIDDVGLLEIK